MKKILKYSSFFIVLALAGCSKDDGVLSFDEQLEKDLAILDNHIMANNIDAEKHDSGIWFINSVVGDGESPSLGDRVALKFQYAKLDEKVVSEDTIGFTLELNEFTILSLQNMIPEMNVGGKMKFYAPSGYCFGRNSSDNIPANSNLVFWVELLDVIKNEEDQLAADQNIISEYLQENNIETQAHDSGIRYLIDEVGSGDSPVLTDEITVEYKGTFLNGSIFDQSLVGVTFPLENLIEAWKIMIPTMKEGGKITIYAPSEYCYGTNGSGAIPPNTILVFEIELISIS